VNDQEHFAGIMNNSATSIYICPHLLPLERVAARRAMIEAGQLHPQDEFVVFAKPTEADTVCAMLCSSMCGITHWQRGLQPARRAA
jgi:hypothetical protein